MAYNVPAQYQDLTPAAKLDKKDFKQNGMDVMFLTSFFQL